MNQTYIRACYFIYQEKERFLSVINFSSRSERNLEEGNQSTLMALTVVYDACKWLRLKHIIYGTELKNIIERFIQQIKDRTECFDDHFPCRIKKCDRQHVRNWLKMFILFLEMNTDRIKFTIFLLDGG
jgi:hypothetical protein